MTRLLRSTLALGLFLVLSSVAPAHADQTPEPADPALQQQIDVDQEVATDDVVREQGHVDVGPRFADGRWSLMVHDDTDAAGSVWRDLDHTVFRVRDSAVQQVPDDPAYAFLGVEPGAPVHVVPQTQATDVVWIGWNTQDPEVMANVDRGVTLSLTGVSGPGDLVVYLQDGGFGDPDVLWSTTAGDAGPQPIFVDVNTHTYANWVFTEPGVYLVSIEAAAQLVDGTLQSATGTVRVAVGDAASTDEALSAPAPLRAPTAPEPPSAPREAVTGAEVDAPLAGFTLAIGAVAALLAATLMALLLRGRAVRRRALGQS